MEKQKYYKCIPDDFWKMTQEDCHAKNYLDAYSILARGFWCCENKPKEGKLLLTGINPSYTGINPSYNRTLDIQTTPFSDLKGGFWEKKKEQFGELWNDDTMSYLDLFPIRETDQRRFEQSFDVNEHVRSIRGNILKVTQDAIEEMKPRLIVHANKGSLYYWGIKKNTPAGDDANDYEHPWLGYKVKRVTPEIYKDLPLCMRQDDRLSLFPLYEIVGFIDSDKRINHIERQETNLKFIMEYVMDGRHPKYNGKLYQQNKEKKEWDDIWNWVKKHS